MKEIISYKSLKELINQTKSKQFTLNNFFNNRIYHKEKGHIIISLSGELKKEIGYLFLNFLGIDKKKYQLIYYILAFDNIDCYGIFDRLIINKKLQVEYIAGQDYPSELRCIKRMLIKEATKNNVEALEALGANIPLKEAQRIAKRKTILTDKKGSVSI